MIIGPKYKICRRLGSGVFEKCQTQKYALKEERQIKNRSLKRRPKALSDYGKRLIEKQKLRFTYGLSEKQMSRYAREAVQTGGAHPAGKLYELIESRLDNVAYRMGLAHSRRHARQLASHGHLMVNGRRVTVPSYHVDLKDVIVIRDASKDKPVFSDLMERLKDHPSISWVSFDIKKMSGTISAVPSLSEADLLDLPLVLEFYRK